jgi:hypothetical protein
MLWRADLRTCATKPYASIHLAAGLLLLLTMLEVFRQMSMLMD